MKMILFIVLSALSFHSCSGMQQQFSSIVHKIEKTIRKLKKGLSPSTTQIRHAKSKILLAAEAGDKDALDSWITNLKKKKPQATIDSVKTSITKLNPLHLATIHGHKELVSHLITHQDADPESTDKNGHTPLHLAAQAGHLPIVKVLAEKYRAKANTTNIRQQSALYLACQQGHRKVARYLIKKCGLNWRTESYDNSPLKIALEQQNRDLVHQILRHQQCLICLEKIKHIDLDKIVVTSCPCKQLICLDDYEKIARCPICRINL